MNRKIDRLANIATVTNGCMDRLNVFADFFELLAIKISNNFDPVHFRKHHDQAENIRKKYMEAELAQFREYFSELAQKYEQNLRTGDLIHVLGKLYEK